MGLLLMNEFSTMKEKLFWLKQGPFYNVKQ